MSSTAARANDRRNQMSMKNKETKKSKERAQDLSGRTMITLLIPVRSDMHSCERDSKEML
jgi:hypothetical protein